MIDKFNGENKDALIKGLLKFAATSLNKTDAEVAALFLNADDTYNDATDVLSQQLASHIESVKGDTSKLFDNGYSKGKKEALSQAERDIKSRYGITSDKGLIDLVSEVVQLETESVRNQFEGKEVTEEDFKKSDFYLSLINTHKEQLQAAEDKAKEVDQVWQKKILAQEVDKYALLEIDKLNPILDADPNRAANQKANLLREINSLNWKLDDDGNLLPLNDDGTHKTNDHGHSVNANEVVKSVVEKFHSLAVSDPHNPIGGGGNPKPNGSVKLPNSVDEYKTLREEYKSNPEALSKIKEHAQSQDWYYRN